MMIEPTEFVEICKTRGIAIKTRGNVLSLVKNFTPGSDNEYSDAESDVSIIYDVPAGCGSIWGTDGGSIGGMVGRDRGEMVLNRSGVKARWMNKLKKLIA